MKFIDKISKQQYSRKEFYAWLCVYLVLGISLGWVYKGNVNAYAGEMSISSINISVANELPLYVAYTGAIGATNSLGVIWIKSTANRSSFIMTCNHEVLHNILKLPSNEISWGESEEHQFIFEIENKMDFKICKDKADEIYGKETMGG